MRKIFVYALAIILIFTFSFSLASCDKTSDELQKALKQGNYELVFEDDFDGDSLDTSKWKAGYDGENHVRRAAYVETTPDTLFVKDGTLTIRTHYKTDGQYGEGWYTSWVESATNPNKGHVAAMQENYEGFSAKYGYFEARCIAPPCEGIWSAFWLMPDEGTGMTSNDVMNTGSDGVEVDIMESPWYYSGFFNRNSNMHVLHGDGYANTKSQKSDSIRVSNMYSEFHTYGVMWTPEEYVFYIDGKETWRTPHIVDDVTLGVSQVKQYMLLTVEVGGYMDEDGNLHPGKALNADGTESEYWCGDASRNDKNKNYDFIIDYVRVYQVKE